jgi:cyclopropane fatty-acyl-phospholipid synthase-like methyltransferase
MAMHSRALGLAGRIVPAVDLSGSRRLLDVGCGPGTFSRLLAEQYRSLRVTLLDLPGVLAVARELIEASGSRARPRLAYAPASYRDTALPAGHDAALYCGALHQETGSSAADLFARLHDALSPGARLFVIDIMLERDGTAPAFGALFSLNMKLLDPRAGVFRADRAASLIEAAGFAVADPRWLADSPYCMIEATRRS